VSGLRELDSMDDSLEDDAVWQWRFHFSMHWGDHALCALKVLHRLEMAAGWGDSIRNHSH
jgi:uncharacterized protein DUF5063